MSFYLQNDVTIEPLCGRWYAWHHLIAPLQHGMHIVDRHIPLFKSFIANPRIHQEAAKNLELMTGPIMDLAAADVDSVQHLMRLTTDRYEPLIKLVQAQRMFEDRLYKSYTGHCLDSLYAELPASLAGILEFSYDHRNIPRLAVREKFLYSQDPGKSFQEIYIRRTGVHREFFLNTPRLKPNAGELMLPMSFDDERIKLLARMRVSSVSEREIRAQLPELLLPEIRDALLTEQPPQRLAPSMSTSGVRIRYLGHASVLVQTKEVSILIDPLFAYARDNAMATLTINDLPDFIDYVVISHSHQDHFSFESLLQLRERIGTIVVPGNCRGSITDPSMKLALESMGFRSVHVVEDFDSIEIPGGSIQSLPFPGEHCDLEVRTRHCPALSLLGRQFLFLVDSDAVDPALYDRLRAYIRDVDVLFIGMECKGAPLTWLYGPLLNTPVARRDDESRRGRGSNCSRAYNVIRAIGGRQVYVYAMGMEPWNQHLLGLDYAPGSLQITESDRLVQQCCDAGIPAERLKGCREFFFESAAR